MGGRRGSLYSLTTRVHFPLKQKEQSLLGCSPMSTFSQTCPSGSCLSNMFMARRRVLARISITYDSSHIHGGKNKPHSALHIQNQVLINPNLSKAMANVVPAGSQVSTGALGLHAGGSWEGSRVHSQQKRRPWELTCPSLGRRPVGQSQSGALSSITAEKVPDSLAALLLHTRQIWRK